MAGHLPRFLRIPAKILILLPGAQPVEYIVEQYSESFGLLFQY